MDNKKRYFLRIFLVMLILSVSIMAQQQKSSLEAYSGDLAPDRLDKKYITGPDGIVRMYVNVWGHVARPGSHLVYDGIDLVTLFSICGGPQEGANLSKIKLIRETPDENGKAVYEINFNKFMTTGEREQLIKIRPNDTIIIGQKTTTMIMSNFNVLNTVLQLMNIYLQIQRNN